MNQENKKISAVAIIVILVLGIVFAMALSMNKASNSYKLDSDVTNGLSQNYESLIGREVISDNVDFDISTGDYHPTGDDAWILYSGINNSYEGVFLELLDNVPENTEVKIYWTREGDEALSESRTATGYISKDENTLFLNLPSYSINYLRIDIDRECKITSVTLSKDKAVHTLHFGAEFLLAFIIRCLIIIPVLYIAYLAHLERIMKGSHPIGGLFADPVRPGVKHLYEYDYIRTLAAVLVIMMHSVIENFAPSVAKGEPGYLILKMVLAISLVCNVLYIMLSGALLLKPSRESIKDFYLRRLGKVLIPTVSYYLLYMIQGYGEAVFEDGLGKGILTILKGLMTSRPEYMLHMWFIYAILGLYIFAPFLRILIANITEAQLFGLIVAGFVFDIFGTVLPMFGIGFGIDTPIAGWMGVFLLGYYITTEHAKNKYPLFMILGALGLVTTCILVYQRPDLLYYESNWAPLMWLEGAGIFAFFIYFRKIFGKRNIIIASISKYNFSIMLVHVLLLMKVILPTGWRLESEYGHLRIFILGIIIVCFVMSYLVSVLYDNTAVIAANYIYSKLTKKNNSK